MLKIKMIIVKVMKMKQKILFILSFLLIICLINGIEKARAEVNVSAESAALMNADTGEFLFVKDQIRNYQ